MRITLRLSQWNVGKWGEMSSNKFHEHYLALEMIVQKDGLKKVISVKNVFFCVIRTKPIIRQLFIVNSLFEISLTKRVVCYRQVYTVINYFSEQIILGRSFWNIILAWNAKALFIYLKNKILFILNKIFIIEMKSVDSIVPIKK